jgi:hypothetical protein
MAALGADQETGRVPPMAVDAGAPPGQEEETMGALGAVQETGKAPPTLVDAGAPPGRDEEMMAALGPPRRQVGHPQRPWMLGGPMEEKRRQWQPQ